jgi:hypothetical protein
MKDKVSTEFSFKKSAIYKIRVHGIINESWTERLGGMQINVERSQDKDPVSVLVGQINDQAALSGVLNTLYESHLTIISLNMLKDEN